MSYLIDGHNLIPKLPGLRLDAPDDEDQLIQVLQEFCRLQRKVVEVYFDQAPPGFAGQRRYGQVTAHFIRQGSTADDAIRARLQRLGTQASNWTVVSSDAAVQQSARQARARVVSSEAFAGMIRGVLAGPSSGEEKKDAPLSQQEVQDWMEVFASRRRKKR